MLATEKYPIDLPVVILRNELLGIVTLDPMNEVEATSEALVSGICAGDIRCEAAFYRQYQSGVTLMLEKRTNDRARAEDLCHDTMLTVLIKLRAGELRDPKGLTAYVYQTAKYVFLGWIRRAASQTDRFHEGVEELLTANDPERIRIREQEIAATHILIAELSVERDRDILTRYYVKEQPKEEICDALSLSAEHFDRVIHRARTRLKKLMEERALPIVNGDL
ncbi:MAG: RNA polymerase sigma factor [Pseudomonadales bacterium]|jgi:RNA polymerase sigma-70 factor (ECF subfamily)